MFKLNEMRATCFLVLFIGCISKADDTIRMRVVGGNIAPANMYPSAAVVIRSDKDGDTQICGGVVITQRHILTACHCFKRPNTFFIPFEHYKVRVGSTLVHAGGSLHTVNIIMFHPDFHFHKNENDVAIIRTETTMTYSTSVQPATIAGASYNLVEGSPLMAVGWGETSEGGLESEQLRHVEVRVIRMHVCKQMYKNIRHLDNKVFCAGWPKSGGHDHCQRDSGSPLYQNGVVVGIASIGQGCGRAEFPGICVRISNYARWIQDKTNTKSIKM